MFKRFLVLLTIVLAGLIGLDFLSRPEMALAANRSQDLLLRSPDQLSYPPLRFVPPKAQRIVLPNGLTVYILEDRSLPLIHLTLAVRSGSVWDPAGKEGLADIATKVMRTGGAGKMSGQDIDEVLEFMGGSIEPSTAMDHTYWSLDVLKEDVGKGMTILSQILQAPRFDEDKLKLAQALKLEELRRIYDDPQKLAFREFNRLLYRDDPRGRLSSAASVKGLSREDLRQFHETYYFPRNIMIAISGDISAKDAIGLIQDHLGSWTKEGTTVSLPLPVPKRSGQMRYIVKETPQSIIVTGQFAPAKKSGEYYAFDALDFLVGSGGFRSRIFQEIRTNRGLAYSAGSFYRAHADYGIFGTYAMTKTESAPTVLGLIQSILKEIKAGPPVKKELAWAKKSIINRFIFEFQSSSQIVSRQMMNEYNRLPDDFLLTYCEKIDKLTTHDLLTSGSRHVHPDDMAILILGNEDGYNALQKIYPDMEKRKLTYD